MRIIHFHFDDVADLRPSLEADGMLGAVFTAVHARVAIAAGFMPFKRHREGIAVHGGHNAFIGHKVPFLGSAMGRRPMPRQEPEVPALSSFMDCAATHEVKNLSCTREAKKGV